MPSQRKRRRRGWTTIPDLAKQNRRGLITLASRHLKLIMHRRMEKNTNRRLHSTELRCQRPLRQNAENKRGPKIWPWSKLHMPSNNLDHHPKTRIGQGDLIPRRRWRHCLIGRFPKERRTSDGSDNHVEPPSHLICHEKICF